MPERELNIWLAIGLLWYLIYKQAQRIDELHAAAVVVVQPRRQPSTPCEN